MESNSPFMSMSSLMAAAAAAAAVPDDAATATSCSSPALSAHVPLQRDSLAALPRALPPPAVAMGAALPGSRGPYSSLQHVEFVPVQDVSIHSSNPIPSLIIPETYKVVSEPRGTLPLLARSLKRRTQPIMPEASPRELKSALLLSYIRYQASGVSSENVAAGAYEHPEFMLNLDELAHRLSSNFEDGFAVKPARAPLSRAAEQREARTPTGSSGVRSRLHPLETSSSPSGSSLGHNTPHPQSPFHAYRRASPLSGFSSAATTPVSCSSANSQPGSRIAPPQPPPPIRAMTPSSRKRNSDCRSSKAFTFGATEIDGQTRRKRQMFPHHVAGLEDDGSPSVLSRTVAKMKLIDDELAADSATAAAAAAAATGSSSRSSSSCTDDSDSPRSRSRPGRRKRSASSARAWRNRRAMKKLALAVVSEGQDGEGSGNAPERQALHMQQQQQQQQQQAHEPEDDVAMRDPVHSSPDGLSGAESPRRIRPAILSKSKSSKRLMFS